MVGALPKTSCNSLSQSGATPGAPFPAIDMAAVQVAVLRPGIPIISTRDPVLSGCGISGCAACVVRLVMRQALAPTGATAVPKVLSRTGKHIWLRVYAGFDMIIHPLEVCAGSEAPAFFWPGTLAAHS